MRAALPPLAVRATAAAFAMANVQAALAGSVALLSAVFHVLLVLRRPGQAALAWR
ncbi:hypothetical protein EDB92DRAFT_1949281 [Lactarius akahatsu]|uniref:Uncharacterized protein n=1 Tax=Lactarius akahatsu TaxID=416441 RepID=A0AAD4QAY2_9AGAM|nr:hypothetical protein EDB92DRAFT_1949281 [Lactarius akahatsu]